MEGGVVEDLYPLSLFSLFPGESNLWVQETIYPSPGLCCHDLYDAVRDVGDRNLCSLYSTCCTSLHTASPTADTVLFPNDHDLQDSDPSVHMVQAPSVAAFVHQGFGSGSHQESETATSTERVLLPLLPPRLLPGRKGESLVIQSGDIQKTLIESGILNVSGHNCVHFVWNKGNVGKTDRGSVNGIGIDWGNRSKTWTWTWILIWSESKEND